MTRPTALTTNEILEKILGTLEALVAIFEPEPAPGTIPVLCQKIDDFDISHIEDVPPMTPDAWLYTHDKPEAGHFVVRLQDLNAFLDDERPVPDLGVVRYRLGTVNDCFVVNWQTGEAQTIDGADLVVVYPARAEAVYGPMEAAAEEEAELHRTHYPWHDTKPQSFDEEDEEDDSPFEIASLFEPDNEVFTIGRTLVARGVFREQLRDVASLADLADFYGVTPEEVARIVAEMI